MKPTFNPKARLACAQFLPDSRLGFDPAKVRVLCAGGYDYLEQEIHKPKDFEWFIYMSHVLQGYEVTLTSSKFAKAVYMTAAEDDFFEDNYFDILPGESKVVKVKSVLDRGVFVNKFNIVSLSDTY